MTFPPTDRRVTEMKWRMLLDGRIKRCGSCGSWMFDAAWAWCDTCQDGRDW